MTPSNLDLARECGAYVYQNDAEIVFNNPTQLDTFAARIRADERASAPAQPDHRAALESLKAVGSKLANCAFNLSQRIDDPMTRDIATTLGQLQREWDAASIALRQALEATVQPIALPAGMPEHDSTPMPMALGMAMDPDGFQAWHPVGAIFHCGQPSPTAVERKPLTQEQYTELAHRIASKYTHRSDPKFTAYTFLPHTLEQFVRSIEATAQQGGDA